MGMNANIKILKAVKISVSFVEVDATDKTFPKFPTKFKMHPTTGAAI